jgi:hypothetical protein
MKCHAHLNCLALICLVIWAARQPSAAQSPATTESDPIQDAEFIRHAEFQWTRNRLILEQQTVSAPAFDGCRTLGEAFAALENAFILHGSANVPSGQPAIDEPVIEFKISKALKNRPFTRPPEFPPAKASLLRVLRWICAAHDCDARLTLDSVEVISRQKEPTRDLLSRPGLDELRLDERLRRLENTVLPAFEIENGTVPEAMELLQQAVDQADLAAGRKLEPLNMVLVFPGLVFDGAVLSLALRDVPVREVLQYCADLAQHELSILPEVIESRPISTHCGEAGIHVFKLAKAPVEKLLAQKRRFPPPPDRFCLTGEGGRYDRASGVFTLENAPTHKIVGMEHFLWSLGALETRTDSRPLLRQKLSPITGKTMLPRLSLKAKTLNEALVEVERLAAAAGKSLRLIAQASKPVETDIWLDWRDVSLETTLYYLSLMSACEVTVSGTEVLFRPLER